VGVGEPAYGGTQVALLAGMNLTWRLSSVVWLLCVLSSRLALADVAMDVVPVAPPASSHPPRQLLGTTEAQDASRAQDSYAGEIILGDLAAVGAAALIASKSGAGLAVTLPWLIVSPTIHGLHGNAQSSGLSFLLHAGLPLTFGFVGFEIESASCTPNDWFCGLGGAALGGLVGMLSATIVDAAVLAHRPAIRTTASRQAHWSILPTASIASNGTPNVGLLGTF
jgi:hypothetical protein